MTAHLPLIADIANPQLTQALQHKLDHKTKPLGSLGRLEQLALRIGQILGTESPRLEQPQMVVFAGDHGLAARGVSAFPSDVTWQMVENFLAGGAAVSVLARQHGLALTVVDCGVARDIAPRAAVPGQPQLLVRKVAAGTQDASIGPAMTPAQCAQALHNGMDVVRGLPGNALLLGEMGIGNTSVASLLLARLCGVSLEDCTGAGTGLDAGGVARKRAVLAQALATQQSDHAPYGGVVPEIAARAHLAQIDRLYEQALRDAGLSIHQVDAVAATAGPGERSACANTPAATPRVRTRARATRIAA